MNIHVEEPEIVLERMVAVPASENAKTHHESNISQEPGRYVAGIKR
jgi:hypothetical protein